MIDTYLNQQIQIQAVASYNAYGKPVQGTASTIKARFVEKEEILKDDNGQEFKSDAQLWVLPTQTLDLNHLVIYETLKYRIAKIETRRAFEGIKDHKKAYLVRVKNG